MRAICSCCEVEFVFKDWYSLNVVLEKHWEEKLGPVARYGASAKLIPEPTDTEDFWLGFDLTPNYFKPTSVRILAAAASATVDGIVSMSIKEMEDNIKE